MNKHELKRLIQTEQSKGKKTVGYLCDFVPQEILAAAQVSAVRLGHLEDYGEEFVPELPKNLCPSIRENFLQCEHDFSDVLDLIIAETSCDGKKKMFELLSNQEKLYYFQIPQGTERGYVHGLIRSEAKYLARELGRRFQRPISEDDIRQGGTRVNALRQSIVNLMELQKQTPPLAWGKSIFDELEKNRWILDLDERTRANQGSYEQLLARPARIPANAKRILVTGCPLTGIYRKVLRAVEEQGAVVVCIENCEVLSSNRRSFNTEAEDVYEALANCYQETTCAIMADNSRRFNLIGQLAEEYKIHGILDVALSTCHAYSVERYNLKKFSNASGFPYLALETNYSDVDEGQITTRICAFLEML